MLVSAATTLAVLFAWDFFSGRDLIDDVLLPQIGQAQPVAAQAATAAAAESAAPAESQAAPAESQAARSQSQADRPTLPPTDVEVIQITLAAGVGDLNQEVLTLKRVGEGDLHMAGWTLKTESGKVYTFPESPELVLFAGGAVRLFSMGGTDTATEIYWNRSEPAYASNEQITLLDPQGNVRATYRVP
jgi:hypothetical protein